MTRRELLEYLVLGEIADHYEEHNDVYENVAACANALTISVQPSEVDSILLDLVRRGLAHAYILPSGPS